MHFSIFAKMRKSCENGSIFAKFCEISFCANFRFRENVAKTKNPLNLTVIRHARYMWCNFLPSHFRRIKRHMWGNFRIQLPLGPKRKFQFRIFAKFSRKYENFRAKTKIFAKIPLLKLTLIAELLLMWNTWGMGHRLEYCLLKWAF
jgi:hypothetical protein